MPAKFSKGDRVRAMATVFDGGEESRDRNGLLLSEKCAADKNGEWCYGTVSFVDSFLACRKLMVRWQEEGDEVSLFWKFVAVFRKLTLAGEMTYFANLKRPSEPSVT